MSVYFFTFGTSLFFALLSTASYRYARKETVSGPAPAYHSPQKTAAFGLFLLGLVLSMLPLILVSGLRSQNIGLDTRTYANEYQNIATNRFGLGYHSSWLSPGYVILCKIVALFAGENPVAITFVVAMFTFLFLFLAVYQNSSDFFLSIYLYFCSALFFQTMNQSRQQLAISVTTYSLTYIKRRDFRMFLTFVLLAASIHASALAFLPAYFLANLKINKRNFLFYLTAAACCVALFPLLTRLLQYTGYGWYIGSVYDIEARDSAVWNLVFRLLLLAGFFCFVKGVLQRNPQNRILYNMAMVCVILQVLTVQSYIFGRVTTYYFIFFIFLIPEIVHSARRSETKLFLCATVMILFAAYFALRVTPQTLVEGKFDNYHMFF